MHHLTSRAAMKAHQRLSSLPKTIHTPLRNGDDPEDLLIFTDARRPDLGAVMKRVRSAFQMAEEPMGVADVAIVLKERYGVVQTSINKLWKAGVLRRIAGKKGAGQWVFCK